MDQNLINRELKGSPLFNLSLGSKELFHTNFIGWLCNNYTVEMGEILSNYFALKEKDTVITNVARELKNIDLSFSIGAISVIVENKVKSIPDKTQLISYKEKSCKNSLCILLTMIKPDFNASEIGWHVLTYDNLALLIGKLAARINNTNNYHTQILDDYIFFISSTSNLLRSISFDISEGIFDFYGNEFLTFKELKMHDLYLKHTYHRLIQEIKNDLCKRGIKNVIIGNRYSENTNTIIISFNIVNGKGVVNIDYSSEEGIRYGIMLDGNRYNHYIFCFDDRLPEMIERAELLRSSNKWFAFAGIEDFTTYPKKTNFNKYGEKMRYRSFKIHKMKISDLFERISLDVCRMTDF